MQMATVMMSTTLKPVFLMVEIAVDLMLIQYIAENVNALKEEGIVEGLQHLLELQHLLKLQVQLLAVIKVGLEMGIVMISTIILIVALMVVTVVVLCAQIIAHNVCVLKMGELLIVQLDVGVDLDFSKL